MGTNHIRAKLGATAAVVVGVGVVAVASLSFAGHMDVVNVASESSVVTGSPRCHTAYLSLSVVADTARRHHGGGMNHQGTTIALRNISKHTCHVRGYIVGPHGKPRRHADAGPRQRGL